MRVPTKALPMWLASTFNALAPEHPLRELLPPSPVHEGVMEASTRNDASLPCSQEASIDRMFAFSPFDADVRENNNTSRGAPRPPSANPVFCDAGPMPCDPTIVNAELKTFHLGEDTLGFRPFSTPGSLAVLEHAGISNHPRNLTRPSEPQKISTHVNTPLLSNDASVNHANFTSSPVIRQSLPEPETYLSSVYRGSSIAASNDLGPHSPTPDFLENDLMNIFSTPGPAFTVSRPVYFDSPTEDPSLSDPLEPDSYELDLDALDFRWQPFLRKSLPDTSLANQQTYTLHASATVPPVFEDRDVLSSLSPPSFCGVADDQAAMPEAPDARVEYDRHDGPLGGSPVSDHVVQQSSSPQLNGQSGTVVFAPTLGIFISPLQGAPSSPAVPGMVDAQDEQVETQGSTTVSPHETKSSRHIQTRIAKAFRRT
ncbi:hypothetical protein DEU56DRAFT_543806 [Suillus clintonianus]|uniref:uncharacterized protein n=1 Tax=Suillus clintonianus TaxID=1904413 RepID=UPI001B87FAA2|nr:uncharacterized protein DEU56DRAFT_543806 [Suillus clintonianus]KAG2126314.1 hypothetical protein DEU56DRAFT_543806 [Suillus clintonianus]